MTTSRENLLRIFRHERPEWIPVCGHCDPYNQPNRDGMDPRLATALGTVQWCDESSIHFSRYLGIDIMSYLSPPVRITRKKVTVETARNGDDTVTKWRTPAGELRQIERRCREDGTSYLVEHMVKGPADLPALTAIFEDEQLEFEPEGAAKLQQRQQLISDGGLLMCFMPGTPLGMMYRVFSGVEALMYLCADAPQEVRDLFAVMERNYQRQFQIAVHGAADVFVSMDDTSTTVISPAMFEQFNMELTDQRADICHRAGKIYFHHSCGLIRDLLPLYRRTKMDAVHAFTVPPIGNVTIAEGRRALGDRITIMAGTAPLADVNWDAEVMKAKVRRMFEDAGRGDHFILNLAAYPHKTMAQTKTLVEACRKYQRLI